VAGAWSVGTQDLEDIGTALRYEQDGMKIRRQIAAELRKAVEPAIADAKGRITAMHSTGLAHKGEPLRTAIASKVKAQARLSGKASGVRVRVATTPDLRGFRLAPRRANRRGGWRHPVYGNRDRWVHQTGAIGWFDDAMHANPDRYVAALQQVIEDAARRIRNGAR
jgi:CubicO group peptidase (beta-lactamase class C family)